MKTALDCHWLLATGFCLDLLVVNSQLHNTCFSKHKGEFNCFQVAMRCQGKKIFGLGRSKPKKSDYSKYLNIQCLD